MLDPLGVDLPGELRRLLQTLAQVGLLGGTDGEVAAYLITRGIDDMTRDGVLSLTHVEAAK